MTASVLLGAVVPEDSETLVTMSAPKATRPAAAPGLWPTGLPQSATRAIPTRSPAWTGTPGESATVTVVPVVSKGPLSSTKRRVLPEGRKNLILTVAAHGAEDHMKVAEVMVPEPVAGEDRSMAVIMTGVGSKPKFGEDGRLPAEMDWARPTPGAARTRARESKATDATVFMETSEG
jgi:hypothetical protein